MKRILVLLSFILLSASLQNNVFAQSNTGVDYIKSLTKHSKFQLTILLSDKANRPLIEAALNTAKSNDMDVLIKFRKRLESLNVPVAYYFIDLTELTEFTLLGDDLLIEYIYSDAIKGVIMGVFDYGEGNLTLFKRLTQRFETLHNTYPETERDLRRLSGKILIDLSVLFSEILKGSREDQNLCVAYLYMRFISIRHSETELSAAGLTIGVMLNSNVPPNYVTAFMINALSTSTLAELLKEKLFRFDPANSKIVFRSEDPSLKAKQLGYYTMESVVFMASQDENKDKLSHSKERLYTLLPTLWVLESRDYVGLSSVKSMLDRGESLEQIDKLVIEERNYFLLKKMTR